MQEPDERSHGSGIRNANTGQTSDRQELLPEQHGDSRPAANNNARKTRSPNANTGSGAAEEDTQEMDASDEARKIERLGRDPAEGPPARK